ncbi:cbb3-type cytochrome oxidase maturation protein [Bradyrhizobium sp. USDA 4472]
MEILVILVPLALMLGLAGLAAFLWSLRSGQYDDLDGAAWRAIADDDDETRSLQPGRGSPLGESSGKSGPA